MTGRDVLLTLAVAAAALVVVTAAYLAWTVTT
jgi:hypothetical protein